MDKIDRMLMALDLHSDLVKWSTSSSTVCPLTEVKLLFIIKTTADVTILMKILPGNFLTSTPGIMVKS